MIPFGAVDLTLFTGIITFILGGGLVGAWQAFRKTPYEAESISVTTLRGVIQELREEVERLKEENVELRASVAELRQNL